jgi:cytochrome c oxidase subunit II
MKQSFRWGPILVAIFMGTLILAPACAAATTVTATATAVVTATQPVPTVTVTLLPTFVSPTSTYASNGQRIFLTATSASGQPIYSEGYMMYPRYISCSSCHGIDGRGSTVFMMLLAPDITWTALTDPKQHNPPYSDESLERAIAQGFDSSGQFMSVYMPRWQMTTEDLIDLVNYIKTLK